MRMLVAITPARGFLGGHTGGEFSLEEADGVA